MAEPRPLGPRWTLAQDDAAGLVLVADTAGEARRLVGLAVVGLASGVTAWALVAATPAAMELVTWPAAALLAVVAVLSGPAAVRAWRRRRDGLRLALLDGRLQGTPLGSRWLGESPLAVPASEARRVLVRRRADGPARLSSLEVELASGARLEGPLVALAEGEADPLEPVAAGLARRLGVPLVIPGT